MDIIQEVKLLYDITQFINNIINNDIFELLGHGDQKEVAFKTKYHYQYFYIGVLELIKNLNINNSLLNKLNECCNFGVENSKILKNSINEFSSWLNESFSDKIRFLSINKEYNIVLDHYSLIYLCANYSKHTVSNLSSVCKMFMKKLNIQGQLVEEKDTFYLIKEFFEKYNDRMLLYHSSIVAKYLNDIRWGIQDYLIKEFEESIQFKEHGRYEYTIPKSITTDIDQYIYWELMNEVRQKPYVSKFNVNIYLRKRY